MAVKKTKLNIGISNPEYTVGFGQVKDFDGSTMLINPQRMKEALFALTAFDKKRDHIKIGITDKVAGGAFFIFLDEKCEMAIITMGRVER